MICPAKLTDRRAELLRQAEEQDASMLALMRDQRVTDARLAEIEFAIAVIEDGNCGGSGEAGEQGSASEATSGAPGGKIAPAGTAEAAVAFFGPDGKRVTQPGDFVTVVPEGDLPKKPRAPKRDIRGLVLRYVESDQSARPETVDEIAVVLGVPPGAVRSALAYWQAKGRLTLDGGVVMLRTEGQSLGISEELPATRGWRGYRAITMSGPVDIEPVTHADGPVEIVGQGPVEVEATIPPDVEAELIGELDDAAAEAMARYARFEEETARSKHALVEPKAEAAE